MSEKELSQLGLLDEFSIMELEQRLEFEAWCDGNCSCSGSPNGGCITDPGGDPGGGGGGGGGDTGGGDIAL